MSAPRTWVLFQHQQGSSPCDTAHGVHSTALVTCLFFMPVKKKKTKKHFQLLLLSLSPLTVEEGMVSPAVSLGWGRKEQLHNEPVQFSCRAVCELEKLVFILTIDHPCCSSRYCGIIVLLSYSLFEYYFSEYWKRIGLRIKHVQRRNLRPVRRSTEISVDEMVIL